MPKIPYIERKFRDETLVVIDTANNILESYQKQGFQLTLRQLYYQFVARGLIPNTERSYKQLGSIVNDGRLAGLIDWDHIEDRTRGVEELSHWTSPADIIRTCSEQYRIDKWRTQPCRVAVWLEWSSNGRTHGEIRMDSTRGNVGSSPTRSEGRAAVATIGGIEHGRHNPPRHREDCHS